MAEMTEADRGAFEAWLYGTPEGRAWCEASYMPNEAVTVWQAALAHARGKQEPAACEYGLRNWDGTYSVHMSRSLPKRTSSGWPVTKFYAAPPAESEEASRLREALKVCADAADELYRYQYGGEMRGSYDGKPEREGVFSAGRKARAALAASPAPVAVTSDERMQSAKPKVKVLVWDGRNPDGTILIAHACPMEYWAWELGEYGYWSWGSLSGREVLGGIEAAKAAAQADYERRILSALEGGEDE